MNNKFKIWYQVIKDFIIAFKGSKANIYSSKYTLKISINQKKSIIRFGDGEFKIMNGEGIHYQEFNQNLKNELFDIVRKYEIEKNNSNYILCVPERYIKCKGFKLLKKRVLISSWSFARRFFIEQFNQNINYGDAFCFARDNKVRYDDFFYRLKNKTCIFVHNNQKYANKFENNYNLKTIFIKIPSHNCYKNIDEILNNIYMNIDIEKKDQYFVLVSAGPCGKIITKKLADNDIYTIDSGHCWDEPLI